MLGYENCNFVLRSGLREEVLNHLTETHKIPFPDNTPSFKCFKKFITAAKWGIKEPTSCLLFDDTAADKETTPVFLINGTVMEKNKENHIKLKFYQVWRPKVEEEHITNLSIMFETEGWLGYCHRLSFPLPSLELPDCQVPSKNLKGVGSHSISFQCNAQCDESGYVANWRFFDIKNLHFKS